MVFETGFTVCKIMLFQIRQLEICRVLGAEVNAVKKHQVLGGQTAVQNLKVSSNAVQLLTSDSGRGEVK